MDQAFIEWVISQAGLAGIAAFCIYIVNKVWTERTAEAIARRKEDREDKDALLLAYKDNISTMKEVSLNLSRQSEAFDRLCVMLDKLEK